ncbi:MAG: NUDIX domain-containing protein [Promethearchaeota archaeon]
MSPSISPRASWNAVRLKSPVLAVDAVIQLDDGQFILIRRKNPPFKGCWALPGGLCEIGETVEEALSREVEEETGLKVEPERLIGVFSKPDRDPRGHTVSIAFWAHIVGGQLHSGSDAAGVAAFQKLPTQLAFDHAKILEAAGSLKQKKRLKQDAKRNIVSK